MTSTAPLLEQAWRHHQSGDLVRAEALYRQVLATDPRSLNALFLLGSLCQVQGRTEESILLYRRALAIKPDSAEVLNHLGAALGSTGKTTEALACYREAVRLKPDYAEAFCNLGHLLTSVGDLDQALAACRKALALRPRFPEAVNNLGLVHIRLRQTEEAIRCFREALAQRPQYVEALQNLGSALLLRQEIAEAADCLRRCVELRPNDAGVVNLLGEAEWALRHHDEAASWFRKSLALDPRNPIPHRNLAKLLHELGKYADALASFRQVLALVPDDPEARLLVEVLPGLSNRMQLEADYIIRFYDEAAPRWDKDPVERRGYCSPEWLRSALGSAPPGRDLTVLDIGCGTGLCGVPFRAWAKTLIGVDLSERMLDAARSRGVYDELIHGDALSALQAGAGRFDLVLASDVVLYFGNLGPLTRAVFAALKPGGRFAFTVETSEGADFRLLPVVNFVHSRSYLRRVAEETGFRELSARDVVFPRDHGYGVEGMVLVWSRP